MTDQLVTSNEADEADEATSLPTSDAKGTTTTAMPLSPEAEAKAETSLQAATKEYSKVPRRSNSNFFVTINPNKKFPIGDPKATEEMKRLEEVFDSFFFDPERALSYVEYLIPDNKQIVSYKIQRKVEHGEISLSPHLHAVISFSHYTKIHLAYSKLKEDLEEALGGGPIHFYSHVFRDAAANIEDYINKRSVMVRRYDSANVPGSVANCPAPKVIVTNSSPKTRAPADPSKMKIVPPKVPLASPVGKLATSSLTTKPIARLPAPELKVRQSSMTELHERANPSTRLVLPPSSARTSSRDSPRRKIYTAVTTPRGRALAASSASSASKKKWKKTSEAIRKPQAAVSRQRRAPRRRSPPSSSSSSSDEEDEEEEDEEDEEEESDEEASHPKRDEHKGKVYNVIFGWIDK